MQEKIENLSQPERIQIDLDSMIRDVIRQWWVILLAALAAALLMGTYLKLTYEPEYTTSTTFVVGKSGVSSSSISDNLRSAESLTENFSLITESTVLKKRVCEQLEPFFF